MWEKKLTEANANQSYYAFVYGDSNKLKEMIKMLSSW